MPVVRTRSSRLYRYEPVGLDAWNPSPSGPKPGQLVVKVQPFGCPKNGVMGHCYVADAETDQFYGLVLLNSLTPVQPKEAHGVRNGKKS